MNNLEQRLTAAIAAMEQRDQELGRELKDKVRPEATEVVQREEAEGRPLRRVAAERVGGERISDVIDAPQTNRRRLRTPETIVLRTGRPVLSVRNDSPELIFRDAESQVWKERLEKAKDQIHRAVLASGRVEVQNHPTFDWIGTGWLVRDDIIVTNRHVAKEFARKQGTQFRFKPGTLGRTMKASIDFLEEAGRADERTFKLKQVLHIEGDTGPDMALLKVEQVGAVKLAAPIGLSRHTPIAGQQIATIGYPARDSRIPELDLMEDIFGDVFDKKRLAPGQVIRATRRELQHDCSTLGGNSGSVVLDLESGDAVALHFAGRFLEANFAVPAVVIQQRLKDVVNSEGRGTVAVPDLSAPDASEPDDAVPQARAAASTTKTTTAGRQVRVTIPVHITVDIGDAGRVSLISPPAAGGPIGAVEDDLDADTGEDEDDDELILTEARPEDYADRTGYAPSFLGNGVEVPVPTVAKNAGDVLTFPFKGTSRTLLDYEHFSVMMGKSRKMCIFSAVNIDGKQSKKAKRPGWRTDPRIPESAQLVKGVYGNAPKFSRGHMTRREDPIWGGAENAERGNADSMHLTNAVPQMQPFNAGIWLGLEDYALQNARGDDMRICVFTGPVFRANDPIRFKVKIPVKFWKVIAFIHDETGELSATGYVMSQKAFLQEEEFVFGKHSTAQTSLAHIENMTGLSFSDLTSRDPMIEEGVGGEERPLADFKDIKFV